MRFRNKTSGFAAPLAASLLLTAVSLCASAATKSPVADAAMAGDVPAVRALLQKKVDVNAAQPDGATAIQWAAYRNDPALADVLIAAGADVKAPNHDGATPLYLASIGGNTAVMEKLLSAGADANEVEAQGETPLMLAARNGRLDAIQVLLKHKANVNAKDKLRGTTALMWAAEQGHADAVKVLVENGADVTVASSFDTKGGRAYLADTITSRLNSSFGANGQRGAGRGPGRGPQPSKAAAGAEADPPKDGRQVKADAAATGAPAAEAEDLQAKADAAAAQAAFGRQTDKNGGGLTAMVLAARENCLDCIQALVAGKADVNQRTHYGWTALLTATQNRHYKLASWLLDHGADPNIANNGGWTALYLATDNRNIEGGDYPVRNPDMDHLDYIKMLLAKGANVNARICGTASTPTACKGDSTETRTIFTMQWLYEDGATPFLRASQSSDVTLMKLLLQHGADPKITTAQGVSALSTAAGIGWVEGVTYEWSPAENIEAVKMCLDLGIDPNLADDQGRTALHGAAHKGRIEVIQLLADHGAKLDAHDKGSRDTINGALLGHTWVPIDYTRGLVRVGVQSAIPHPEAEALLAKLMKEKGLEVPQNFGSSICLTTLCGGDKDPSNQKGAADSASVQK